MATNFGDAPISEYMVHKIAKAEGGYNYYLYIHPRAKAIVMREKTDETEYLYANAGFGDSQWDNRDSLTYDTYDKLYTK